jgi:hypothetical protein
MLFTPKFLLKSSNHSMNSPDFIVLTTSSIAILITTMNAGYLSPDRLSTKVSHAPGGHSSISLAWDNPTPNSQQHSPSNIQRGVPSLRFKSIETEPSQLFREDHPRVSLEPTTRGSYSFLEENSLLEQELEFYQRKNKMLRENIFGGLDNMKRFNEKYNPTPSRHYEYPVHRRNALQEYQDYQPRRAQEELDIAVQQQNSRRHQNY